MRRTCIALFAVASAACSSAPKAPAFVARPTFCACASPKGARLTPRNETATTDGERIFGQTISPRDHARILLAFGPDPEQRIASIVDDWILAHEILSADFSKNPIGATANALLRHRWKVFATSWTCRLESDVSTWKKAADAMGATSTEAIEAEFAFHDHLASALDDVSQKTRAQGTSDVESMIDDAWQAQKGSENSVTLLAMKLSNEANVGTSVVLPLVVGIVRWRSREHAHATASAMADEVVHSSALSQQGEWLELAASMKNGSP